MKNNIELPGQGDFFDKLDDSLCFKAMKELGGNSDEKLLKEKAEKFGVAKDKLINYLDKRKALEDKWKKEEKERLKNKPSDYELNKNND